MAAIQIKTASKVVPQCYAYTTPGVPVHDGWTKIGFTERDVETRINEQTHTVGVAHKTWWAMRAAYMTEPYGTFTDKDFHAYLKKLGISRESGTEWFRIEPNTARGNFIDFTQNHGVVSEDDADAVIPYRLRDEQAEAVQRTADYFRSRENAEFLWNAKPRFGKTLSAYDLCMKLGARNILIVTNRPAIANSWYQDYETFFGPQSGYIFVSNVVTSVVTFLLLVPDMIPGLREKASFVLLKQMLRYSFPILVLGIAGIFNQTADKILFPFLFEDKDYAATQLGIYGACFKVAVVMVMFIQAFRYAYEPFIFAKNKDDDNTKAYSEAMKYFIIFSLIIFLGVMYYLDILKYFVDAKYYPGLRVVPIVMLGELFFGIYFNLSFWYKLIDQTQWGAYFSTIGCVVTVLMIVLLAPVYGYMACAWASFASNLLMMILSYAIGQKKFPIQYDIRSAVIYGILAVLFYAAGMLPRIDSEILRLGYRTVLLLIFLAIIIRRDLPLSELPYIGKRFASKKN